jgi:hypothetical protein
MHWGKVAAAWSPYASQVTERRASFAKGWKGSGLDGQEATTPCFVVVSCSFAKGWKDGGLFLVLRAPLEDLLEDVLGDLR